MIDAMADDSRRDVGRNDRPSRRWIRTADDDDRVYRREHRSAAIECRGQAIPVQDIARNISRGGTPLLLAGRSVTWHDDSNAPRVAVVNEEFARKMFGSVKTRWGGTTRCWDGTRIEVVGIVEDGKYMNLTEDQKPAMFYRSCIAVERHVAGGAVGPRPAGDWRRRMRRKLRRAGCGIAGVRSTSGSGAGRRVIPSRVATVALGVMG